MKLFRLFSLSLLFAGLHAPLFAADDINEHVRAMQAQLDKLIEMVQSQAQVIGEQQKRIDEQQKMISSPAVSPVQIAQGPTADALNIKIERAEREAMTAIKVAGRKKPNDLNMSIGAAVDTAFRYLDGPKGDTDRPSGNDFSVRGAELVFYADVDPYFKTYMVLNATPDAKNNDEATPSLEEAAITTSSLSYAQVKGGRFFVPFGRFSMIHDHDLPFVTRPPSLDNYVGGESGGDGVQVQALIPIQHFLQITGGAFNKVGSNFPLLNGAGNRRDSSELTYFLKALTSFDIGDNHTMEWGLSTLQVPNEDIHRDLSDIEFTYKWHPAGSTLREKLVWGTELLRNNLRSTVTVPPADPTEAPAFRSESKTGYGGYTYLEYFLDPHWSLGPRIDMFENVDPAQQTQRRLEQTYTAFLTYKFSEFSRLRFEGSRHEYFDGKAANEFYFQWTVFWGAHTHGFEQR